MNKNIEVINKKLWAVRFTHLPYIREIEIKLDESVPIHEEVGRIAPGGLMILNKDHPGFAILKDLFPKLMKKTKKQLEKELKYGEKMKDKSIWDNLYIASLQVEQERKLKERQVI